MSEPSGGTIEASRGLDPILCEVVKNSLMLVAQEAGIRAARSAGSTFVAASAEIACTLYDARARLIAQTEVGIMHSAALRAMLQAVLRDHPPETLVEGDVLIVNDPFAGGVHPTDVGAFRPVFHDGKPAFYCGLMMIVSDLGGLSSGGLPANASECFHEGLTIPPTKLYRAGKLDEAIARLICSNSRTPAKLMSDINALAAGGNVAAVRMAEMVGKFGYGPLSEMIEELLDYSERLVRQGFADMPDGVYTGSFTVENDGIIPDRDYPVHVRIEIDGSECRLDFTGTAQQATGAINSTASQTLSCINYALRCHLDPTIPMNEGFYRPIEVLMPEGTVVNCSYPSACNIRLATGQAVIDAVLQALSVIDETRSMAPGATVHTLNIQGATPDGSGLWSMLDVCFGSCGARHGEDGGDGLPLLFHGQAGYERNLEGYEWGHPVRYRCYRLAPDTGGPGRWRGGAGLVKEIEFQTDVVITARATDRFDRPPPGIEGGLAGSGAAWIVNQGMPGEYALPGKITNHRLKAGDVLTIMCPGGGGLGDPRLRDPALVLADVEEGIVSIEAAREIYGVVLNADHSAIDSAATEGLRRG